MHIIDRRLDPGGKSLANRQRFIRRARALVRQAVREASGSRGIREVDEGGSVSIPADGVHEPSFHRGGETGRREPVLPGNKTYVQGDRIARPPQGGGSGSEGSPDGEGEDQFRFILSREEFLEFFLEDLELPNLAKRQIMGDAQEIRRPAGFRTAGPPAALSVPRTLRRSLSRRIALRRPSSDEIDGLKRDIEALEKSGRSARRLAELKLELERQERRTRTIPFIDPVDLRYRRIEVTPEPVARAAMFCLMDVSASMDEHMKDLAKRFFSLLYIFLTRRYRRVEIVFIRHTHEAKEVDEETFFHSRLSGGTVISSALDEMAKIAAERFPANQWNIYGAQASDGDNLSTDNARSVALLRSTILPMSQFYAYLQVGHGEGERVGVFSRQESSLWRAYQQLVGPDLPLAMRKVDNRRDIYPIFRELFERKDVHTGSGGHGV
ncbi:YeaH/YhbH family protein [Aurantimonas sp. MSK8Z-1]|uniref:YeaH/YhbH family protein n=1 Tax=Mangrovibrevibacter kandeliae TaxID=2968473 RepID=UPI0021191388|nr:YeaH/YhbH family protein [Aurantimonas sp. MSK8Z-1]MCW4116315.1 YeaH/YhbH family protein [Aurantimonas sp. MSK8Z-1]